MAFALSPCKSAFLSIGTYDDTVNTESFF